MWHLALFADGDLVVLLPTMLDAEDTACIQVVVPVVAVVL
jgi:hypothetical protein